VFKCRQLRQENHKKDAHGLWVQLSEGTLSFPCTETSQLESCPPGPKSARVDVPPTVPVVASWLQPLQPLPTSHNPNRGKQLLQPVRLANS